MIYFMEFKSKAKTGGQYNLSHLHAFMKSRFAGYINKTRKFPPADIRGPYKQAIHNYRVVKRISPKLIIVSIYSSCRAVFAVWLMKRLKRKVMIIYHGIRVDYRYNNFLGRLIARLCNKYLLRKADIIQASSDFLAADARRLGARNVIIYVARPGVQIEPDKDISSEYDSRKRVSPIKLLYVGECKVVKGIKVLVEALCYLKDIDVLLDIAGGYKESDLYFQELIKIMRANNLADRITFHGALEPADMKKLFEDAAIFVMPSIAEGYGIALGEALLFGLPVVASNTGAIPEIIEDGVNGILVEPGNAFDLASGIKRLALNADIRKIFSENNIEKGKSISRWRDYDQVLDRKLVPAIVELTGIHPTEKTAGM